MAVGINIEILDIFGVNDKLVIGINIETRKILMVNKKMCKGHPGAT